MVPLIPCRRIDDHTVTAEIPETGVRHFAAFEPIDPEDRKRLGYDAPAETSDQTPPADPPAPGTPAPEPTPKPRRSAAGKTNEE
jgi:hypothetical protein